MTVVTFPKKKDPHSVLDFLDSAKEAMSNPEVCPDSILLISYFKEEDEDAIGINIGGKPLSPIQLSGLMSLAMGQIQFADNVASMGAVMEVNAHGAPLSRAHRESDPTP